MKPVNEEVLLSHNLACRIDKIRLDNRKWWVFDREHGLNRRMLTRLFEDGYNPSFHTICKIAKALDVHPKELFDFSLNVKADPPDRSSYFHFRGADFKEKKVIKYQPYK